MRKDTHIDRLLHLAHRKVFLRPIDLDEMGIPRVYLTRLTASGQLEKAGRGLYRLPEKTLSESESRAAIATKVPQAVFCLLSSLQFHDLTTQLPRQVWIAMPSRQPHSQHRLPAGQDGPVFWRRLRPRHRNP